MAKKYDCDIDTDSFIESFRATDDPAASLGKRVKSSPIDNSVENKVARVSDKSASEIGTSPTCNDYVDSVGEYREMFVDDLKYRYHDERYPAIEILPEFISRIDEVRTACRKRRCTMSSYINNVLEQHFKQYEKQITEILTRKK